MSKILIVNDQPYNRALISEELAHEGLRVVSVDNAELIPEHLRDSRPDLVLIDYYLNGFDSWAVFHDIRRKDPNLPVLIYAIKSFDALDRLKQTIAEVLGKKTIPNRKTIDVSLNLAPKTFNGMSINQCKVADRL